MLEATKYSVIVYGTKASGIGQEIIAEFLHCPHEVRRPSNCDECVHKGTANCIKSCRHRKESSCFGK